MKLDDIPKKSPFTVPDSYFEQLPGKVEARISGHRKKDTVFAFKYKLHYAIPAVLILVVGIVWLTKPRQTSDVQSLLATVDTEQLVAYLNNSELTTEDVIDEVDFNVNDIEDIESEVYQLQIEDETLDALLEDIDLENR